MTHPVPDPVPNNESVPWPIAGIDWSDWIPASLKSSALPHVTKAKKDLLVKPVVEALQRAWDKLHDDYLRTTKTVERLRQDKTKEPNTLLAGGIRVAAALAPRQRTLVVPGERTEGTRLKQLENAERRKSVDSWAAEIILKSMADAKEAAYKGNSLEAVVDMVVDYLKRAKVKIRETNREAETKQDISDIIDFVDISHLALETFGRVQKEILDAVVSSGGGGTPAKAGTGKAEGKESAGDPYAVADDGHLVSCPRGRCTSVRGKKRRDQAELVGVSVETLYNRLRVAKADPSLVHLSKPKTKCVLIAVVNHPQLQTTATRLRRS